MVYDALSGVAGVERRDECGRSAEEDQREDEGDSEKWNRVRIAAVPGWRGDAERTGEEWRGGSELQLPGAVRSDAGERGPDVEGGEGVERTEHEPEREEEVCIGDQQSGGGRPAASELELQREASSAGEHRRAGEEVPRGADGVGRAVPVEWSRGIDAGGFSGGGTESAESGSFDGETWPSERTQNVNSWKTSRTSTNYRRCSRGCCSTVCMRRRAELMSGR